MKTFLLILILCFSLTEKAAAEDHNHNLTNNVIGAVIGVLHVEYSYKIFEHLTLGVSGSTGYVKVGDYGLNGSSYNIVGRYYFEPAFQNDSWYLVASTGKREYEISVIKENIKYTAKPDETVAGGIGYHWFWNKFNMNLAAMVSNQSPIRMKDTSGTQYKDEIDSTITGEFNIGWKF